MWDKPWLAGNKHPIEEGDFRKTLSTFPTGVCIVTTCTPEGKREGLTVSSFNAVSTAPPLVLWSLTRRSASAEAFRSCMYYGINVLCIEQCDLATVFSRRAKDKFADHGHLFKDGYTGVPLLSGAVATLECRNIEQHYGGDHLIFLGSVEHYQRSDGEALGFYRSRYARLVPVV